jgi:hypothetical protein
VAAGGLSAQDASVADVVRVAPGPPARVGSLPVAAHDAGAASLDGRAYAFGGGTASGGLDAITRLDPDGTATVVGHLPVAMSDTTAATIGPSIDVVGGYSTVPLRSVLSFRPGRPVRQIATVPHPTRYAAAAGARGRLVVAGGTDGTVARRDVLELDRGGHTVRLIGHLPRPTAHAAAAALGHTVYVLGGRGEAASDVRAQIYAIDSATGRVRPAGRLPIALSDLQAVARAGRIVVVGGRDAHGVVHDEVWTLAP